MTSRNVDRAQYPRPRLGSSVAQVARRAARRAAVLVALLILYYATSLHGISGRTVVLAAVLALCLYWIFGRVLR